MKDPDASAQERETVAAVEARARRVQEQEREAREQARTARREAEDRERTERRAAAEREWAERAERREAEKQEAEERSALQARVEKTQKLAPAIRGALKKAAREQRTTTWSEIQQKTGLHQLGRLDHEDKVELLALVESDTALDTPLWSTLLAADGTAPRYTSTATSHTVSAAPCPPTTPISSTSSPPNAPSSTARGSRHVRSADGSGVTAPPRPPTWPDPSSADEL